jgi:hypothetical protein
MNDYFAEALEVTAVPFTIAKGLRGTTMRVIVFRTKPYGREFLGEANKDGTHERRAIAQTTIENITNFARRGQARHTAALEKLT